MPDIAMDNKLLISSSPHFISGNTTTKIMLTVILALLPALIAGVVFFGPQALVLTAVSVICCVGFEYLFCKLVKRQSTISDLSAVVTGMLLAMNLPSTTPVYAVVLGAFVAIVITKMLFGGIGRNFANPALVGRIVVSLAFTSETTQWVQPFAYLNGSDAVTSATILGQIKNGGVPSVSLLDSFLGLHSGCLGEVCAVALIAGGILLMATRVISPIIPLSFIGTVALGALVAGGDLGQAVTTLLSGDTTGILSLLSDTGIYLMSGGLLIGAFFMATDYSTSPLTPKGKLIFGIGCGLITLMIRLFGSMGEGVSFAIVLMNILTPTIDRYTERKSPFAKKKPKKAKA